MNIMKKSFLFILAIVLSLPSFSQVNFGIKAGASTTTVPSYDISGSGTSISALKNAAWGFQAGIFLRFEIGGVYLQPEAVFANNSYDYNVQTSTLSSVVKQSFNRLEVPVLLGVKLGPLRINAGPSARIPIGSPKQLIVDPNWDSMNRGTTFGYQAGIGIDILKTLTLDARYDGSLAKRFGNSTTIGNQTIKLDSRQPAFVLSVGVMF
jgi:hypothetical protein